ncbi:MAG: phosphoribosylamine--glycine ligase [Dehalococcoidia bacterium]
MRILVVGSGAREHTILWKLAQSPQATEIYAAPGNAGMAQQAELADIKADDVDNLAKFAGDNKIDLTVVGPENPLAAGIVDTFREAGLTIFGPTRAAAEIESSKVFTKDLMQRHGIPCAGSASFSSYKEALDYLRQQTPPVVIKADGLAAGKGVIIAATMPEAEESLKNIMKSKTFGDAGNSVVIEEHLLGREMSFFVFTDGQKVLPTVPACDYKRIYDGNQGPNTGGMGSYSPPPFFNEVLGDIIIRTVMEPTILALADEGKPYVGTLYGGLMITNNLPKVIEFNARLGDPETQVVLPRLKSDLVDVITTVLDKKLDKIHLQWHDEACVGVVVASGGYPGKYKTGLPISGLNELDEDIMVFHAGTKPGPKGEILTGGGRVLTVAALGKNLAEARQKVYNNIGRIRFDGCYYRKDIADL